MNEPRSEADINQMNAILRLRADRLALSVDNGSERKVIEQVAVLAVGPELVGIPVSGLRELVVSPPIAPLPQLPSGIVGIVQVRGELFSAVDLATWLKIETDEEPRRLAVIDGPQGSLGLLAHRVVGFRDLVAEDMADDYVSRGSTAETMIRGMTTDLVAILETERLLASEELIVDRAALAGMR